MSIISNFEQHPSYLEARAKGRKYFGSLIGLATVAATAATVETSMGNEKTAGIIVGASVVAIGGLGAVLDRLNSQNLESAEVDYKLGQYDFNTVRLQEVPTPDAE